MKKKILFIMPSLPGGGAEKVLIDILKNFDYRTYAVTLLLEFREGVYLNDVPGEVRVLSLHGQNTIWFERLHRVLRAVRGYAIFHAMVYRRMLLRLLKGERFDTIVSFMEGAALKFHSYITGKAGRNLSWVHIDLKQKHWSLGFFRNAQDELAAYQKIDEIVFVSKDAEKHFSELYPLAEEKRTVIYNLIDRNTILSSSVSSPIVKTKFTICMVGRLNWQKRYDRALAVAKRLHDDGCDFELWILGEGNLESALKETAKAYGIEERVRFLGFKKPSYSYMREADLFLNTSEAEGYPLVICEALCLGLAIVATGISGASEILAGSEYGLLTGESEEDIYRGVKLMMGDETLRNHYREKARQRAAMFDVPATMEQIYKIL